MADAQARDRHPPDPALVASSGLCVEDPSEADLETLRRQLGYTPHPLAVGARCRHGFPQAFVWDPLSRQEGGRAKRVPVDSGLFRLTCPLLVKAIDEWEAEGAVASLNQRVAAAQQAGDGTMHNHLVDANRRHAQARRALVGARVYALAESEPDRPATPPRPKRTGPPVAAVPPTRAELTELVLDSGVAGMSPAKAEVKCLHAQVADHLCRGRTNPMGALIIDEVAARGVAVNGDSVCRQQCDGACSKEAASFWYVPVKNKHKLRTRIVNRKERRKAMLGLQPQPAGAAAVAGLPPGPEDAVAV